MTPWSAKLAFVLWSFCTALLLGACGSGAEQAAEHIKKGNALVAEGKHEAAIAEFKKAADLNKDSIGPQMLIGDSYLAMKKYDEALAAYGAAKKADRKSAKPYLASARLRMEAGQVDAAVADLDQVTELDPGNVEGMLLQAQASLTPRPLPGGGMGVPPASLERAMLNLVAVERRAFDNVQAQYWLAKLNENAGRKDQAREAWIRARDLTAGKPEHAKLAPEIAEALNRLK